MKNIIHAILTIGRTFQAHLYINSQKINIIVICLLLISCVSAKDINANSCCNYLDEFTQRNVCIVVETMPVFNDTLYLNLLEYLHRNFKLKNFDDIQSSYRYKFIVDINGEIVGARIINKHNIETSDSKLLTENEAALLHALNNMKPWIPGRCGSLKVPILMEARINVTPNR